MHFFHQPAETVEALSDKLYDQLGKYYGKHDVGLCYMPGMGKGNAAGVAASLKVSYPGVELVLLVGFCGGASLPSNYQEIFLRDVIISDFVVKYDFDRQYPGGFQ